MNSGWNLATGAALVSLTGCGPAEVAPGNAAGEPRAMRDPYGRSFRLEPAQVIQPIEVGVAFRGSYRAVLDASLGIATCTDADLVAGRQRLTAMTESVVRSLRDAGFAYEMGVVEREFDAWVAEVLLAGCLPERDRNLASMRRWEDALARLQLWLPAPPKEN